MAVLLAVETFHRKILLTRARADMYRRNSQLLEGLQTPQRSEVRVHQPRAVDFDLDLGSGFGRGPPAPLQGMATTLAGYRPDATRTRLTGQETISANVTRGW